MKKIIFLLLGGVTGALVTKIILKDKFERQLKKERDIILNEYNNFIKSNKINDETDNKTDDKKYEEIKKEYSSKNENVIEDKNIIEKIIEDKKEDPYIISIDEFDTKGYDLRYWFLYSDGVVVDEDDAILTKVELEYSVGDCLDNYANIDEDVIYIRNDMDETDYEIKVIDSDYYENDED